VQAPQNGDYYAWALETAENLRAGRLSEVDLGGVAQELEDMGKARRHALASHLKVLNIHLLKWRSPRVSLCASAGRRRNGHGSKNISGRRFVH